MSTPKPYPTLPESAQRDTKRKRATMQRFNEAIDEVLRSRGFSLDFSCAASQDSLLGYDVKRWSRRDTPAGMMTVSPAGHSVMCRFDDPDAAKRARVGGPLNEYSGKWNHHYFGWEHDHAVRSFTYQLDRVLALKGDGVSATSADPEIDPAGRATP
jgi:hypothetical protein